MKEFNKKPWLSWLFFFIFLIGVSYFANFRSDTIYDADSFYHIRHSWLYSQEGILFHDFPWTQYSVIKDLKADLWYGFHLLLIPFTYFDDLTLGIKIAGFFTTLGVILSLYFSLKNLGASLPFFWSLFFIFSSPTILFRMAMTRPHAISLAFSALIFSFLIKGSSWLVLLFTFFSVWIHSSLFWFPLVIVSVISLFAMLNRGRIPFTKYVACLAGVLAGLFLRPNPIANLKLIYIQIVDLYLSKKEVLNQIIGGELRSPTLIDFFTDGSILILLVIIGLGLAIFLNYKKIRIDTSKETATLSSLVLVFLSLLMYINAKRAIDIFAVFTIIFVAIVSSSYLSLSTTKNYLTDKKRTRTVGMIVFIFIALIVFSSIWLSEDYLSKSKLRTAFKEPALWLKENTKEKDIVFHLSWDQFPMLFFWNQHNYYINGMDPIFLYTYDKNLYWKVFYMFRKDMGGLTCEAIDCGPENIETVHDVLTKDFKASYVFTRKITNPRFGEYLASSPQHFEKVYDEGSTVIYRIIYPKNNQKKPR